MIDPANGLELLVEVELFFSNITFQKSYSTKKLQQCYDDHVFMVYKFLKMIFQGFEHNRFKKAGLQLSLGNSTLIHLGSN